MGAYKDEVFNDKLNVPMRLTETKIIKEECKKRVLLFHVLHFQSVLQ